MIHFKPSALFRTRVQAQPQPASPCTTVAQRYSRGDHARMLAHAATRRLAARDRSHQDADYWKACAPAAVAKAASIRAEAGFARLP